ncbi:MAG: type III-A CRISPR-associated protein Csm2 [Ruminococcus sp.]|nr:type III-A CRISPR-associated protein Csm2 [Ruminococcus sp.]
MKLESKTYVKQAEDVIRSLETDRNGVVAVTSSQMRNLLTLVNELYNAVRNDTSQKLSDELVSRTQYVKMRIAYNAGRDKKVKEFAEKSKIMDYLDGAGDSREELILVCHYMEALVAYHKFYRGEKEND